MIFSENEQKNEENRTDSGGFVDIRIFNIITGYHHVWRKTRDLRDLRNMNFPEILLDTAFTMVQNRGNYHQRSSESEVPCSADFLQRQNPRLHL